MGICSGLKKKLPLEYTADAIGGSGIVTIRNAR